MDSLRQRLRDLGLAPTPGDLGRAREAMAARIREGAAADGGEAAMLPAWLAPPLPGLRGEAVAIDAGGTHLRAARVVVGGAGAAEPRILQAPLPGAAGAGAATAAEFFGAHADLVGRLGAPPGTPIGYCFSYPSRVLPDGDAVLVRWTKEVRVPGVEGQRVGFLLSRSLAAAGIGPGPVFVLNDTIAALAAGSVGPGIDPARTVGLVVGTGTNMGAFLPTAAVGKLPPGAWPHDRIAVNFESGGLVPPGLGPVDDEVDRLSLQPGLQRFEKAVSGAYLGRIFRAAAPRLGVDLPSLEGEGAEVSALAEAEPRSSGGLLARAILDRSADLVAAALAAAADVIGAEARLHVCAEGSLVERAPGYRQRVLATLGGLLPGARITLRSEGHANLRGAGLAVLAHAAALRGDR